ncbi:PREDICTED: kelch domain-containing protein 3-like [Amphimedon queenslandica]|uniref:Uncharacterized protein n=1 Tax=Amphimedon queenslandica TaxID=400682 RepID=A0AAN0JUD7_AMPQE|nr:PREDICTED: kelch domain-containing protein 3-like [Amphimedon queenslandica]|eukprot:XP_019860760.1 PREDICTED: kelch domain-containing protein 3-like [Amphimedon queenslandica]
MASKNYQPVERYGHSTVKVGDYLYMWGGDQPDLPETHDSEMKKEMTSLMDMCHLPTGKWEQRPTNGNPPLGVWGYSSVAIGKEIYYFGGYCGHSGCYHNSLHSFNVDTFTWRELSPSTSDHGPMMKANCGMVALHSDGEDYLVVIAGKGSSSNDALKNQPSAKYARSRCNEIHYYKISAG